MKTPSDPQSVFDAIARSATRLCDSYEVIVFRVDGDMLRLTTHFGPMDAQDVPLLPGTLGGRTVLEQRVIQVESLGEIELKGFSKPVAAYNALALRDSD